MILETNDCDVCGHKEVCKDLEAYKTCIEMMRARSDQSEWDKFICRVMCPHYTPRNKPTFR
jgi:hypothetical protein